MRNFSWSMKQSANGKKPLYSKSILLATPGGWCPNQPFSRPGRSSPNPRKCPRAEACVGPLDFQDEHVSLGQIGELDLIMTGFGGHGSEWPSIKNEGMVPVTWSISNKINSWRPGPRAAGRTGESRRAAPRYRALQRTGRSIRRASDAAQAGRSTFPTPPQPDPVFAHHD